MAVAAKNDVASILVLAKKPIEAVEDHCDGYQFAQLRGAGAAALRRALHISPEFIDMAPDPEAMLERADAALVIGDPALAVRLKWMRWRRRSPPGRDAAAATKASIRWPEWIPFSFTM